ncbi:sugar-binding protein [Desertivirga arenae]|uniref:sugar-binding protein n=1 Tax=Desertivirga arenae TaxID=2810309 RepID=UPI001A971190|nr:sugar-binding protein [Pedobacter sp. SYSU D00823]
MRHRFKPLLLLFIPLLGFTDCKKKAAAEIQPQPEAAISAVPYTGGVRISWDYSTLRKISKVAGYNGYARMIEAADHSFICVYESNGNVVVTKSSDKGITWSPPVTVEEKANGINMSVPDILQLNDGSLLVCYNPRPSQPTRRFSIRTKKSYDGGLTWTDGKLLYEADYYFENGCWEPSAIQLPGGEIQLYFANEGTFLSSNEQNISMLRSRDNGITWTSTPEVVSYRAGSRDGMPVPLLLNNKKDIVVAIEDNGFSNFKPYIIRNSLSQNWTSYVNSSSADRSYALSQRIADNIYAGAPFIRQLASGETILSYQGTEGRNNTMDNADMKVVIGNTEARSFDIKSSPFTIPENKSALWNSLAVTSDNKVIALTSTNAFSANSTEVWMIEGHVISNVKAEQSSINVDGQFNEDAWNSPFPLFVGHKGATQVRAGVNYDNENLYVLTAVKDNMISANTSPDESDGVTFYVTTLKDGYKVPVKGIFSFLVTVDNKIVVREGENGGWLKREISSVRSETTKTNNSYRQEIAIPWTLLGGKPALDSEIALNLGITEASGKQVADYRETITNCMETQSSTWLRFKIK